MLITINDLQTQKANIVQISGSIMVGLLNSVVVFGAVLGIGPAPAP
jgi:hypothetical protein